MGRAAANFANTMGLAGTIRQLKLALFDDYRPELHYMRGPGPKWREKHDQQPVISDLSVPNLREAGA